MSSESTDWLLDLDLSLESLPDIRKAAKPKHSSKALKHIKGEKHPFIPQEPSRVPIREPRKLQGEAIPKVIRSYWISNLKRASYNPTHLIGVSPFWPQHFTLSQRDFT